MTKKKTSSPSSSVDPATAYALEVASGARVAGPDIRNACARHLKDIKTGAKRGLKWDVEESNKAIRYYRNVLKLNGGDYEGKDFVLLPWQAFIVGSLFGSGLGVLLLRVFIRFMRNPDGSAMFPVTLTLALFLGPTALATIVGLLAAVAPARRAARLDPAEVIRYG